jgi:metallo-beta-lactamase family protein
MGAQPLDEAAHRPRIDRAQVEPNPQLRKVDSDFTVLAQDLRCLGGVLPPKFGNELLFFEVEMLAELALEKQPFAPHFNRIPGLDALHQMLEMALEIPVVLRQRKHLLAHDDGGQQKRDQVRRRLCKGRYPMIELESIGGARTVTGSKHLLRTSRASVLLDCGLFQGRRREAFERNRNIPIDPGALDAVVLSHAHIDHSGALPILTKMGYGGPVFATFATSDLVAPMLLDAALIQAADARHIARLVELGADVEPVTPLYGEADVRETLKQLVGLPYRQKRLIAPGVGLTLLDAGHVLGSAISVLDVEDDDERMRIAFTGDLGRHHLPLLRDPEVPSRVDCLITESTYGDRLHAPIEEMGGELGDVIRRTYARGGKIVIPSFALERAQEIIYELKLLQGKGALAPLPVYVDSPLALKLTDVFRAHPDCLDAHARAFLRAADSPFEFPGLHYVSSVEDSMAIDADERPSIVIAGSGMCEGGRVLHHLRRTIGDERNTIIIVGFQAQHTLGRRLVEGQREVRIFGVRQERRAEVVVLNGFSAHADQKGLIDFAEMVRDRGPLRRVVLVHGDPGPQKALTDALTARGFPTVDAPEPGTRLRL